MLHVVLWTYFQSTLRGLTRYNHVMIWICGHIRAENLIFVCFKLLQASLRRCFWFLIIPIGTGLTFMWRTFAECVLIITGSWYATISESVTTRLLQVRLDFKSIWAFVPGLIVIALVLRRTGHPFRVEKRSVTGPDQSSYSHGRQPIFSIPSTWSYSGLVRVVAHTPPYYAFLRGEHPRCLWLTSF